MRFSSSVLSRLGTVLLRCLHFQYIYLCPWYFYCFSLLLLFLIWSHLILGVLILSSLFILIFILLLILFSFFSFDFSFFFYYFFSFFFSFFFFYFYSNLVSLLSTTSRSLSHSLFLYFSFIYYIVFSSPLSPSFAHQDGCTALHLACDNGNASLVEFLLSCPRIDTSIENEVIIYCFTYQHIKFYHYWYQTKEFWKKFIQIFF